MARPTPAISVDTNGDFADGKAEVSSSAMYIVRSFGDLTRADSIINCAGARLPMPSNPDEPPHQLRRTPVAVRIGRMQELAEMGYAIICKSCSNSTLNLQFGRWKPDFPAFIVARKRHEGATFPPANRGEASAGNLDRNR